MKTTHTISVVLTTEELVEIVRKKLNADEHAIIDVTIVNTDKIKVVPNTSIAPPLWYPDDSGEWVEVDPSCYHPDGLSDGDEFECLLQMERTSRRWNTGVICLGQIESSFWEESGDLTVVAYKKVK